MLALVLVSITSHLVKLSLPNIFILVFPASSLLHEPLDRSQIKFKLGSVQMLGQWMCFSQDVQIYQKQNIHMRKRGFCTKDILCNESVAKNYATCMGIWEGVLMFLYLSHFITFVSSWMIMIACSDSQNQASKLNQLQMTNHCGNHNSSHIYHKDKVITNIDPWNKEFPWLHGKNVSRHSSMFLLFTESLLQKEQHTFADKTSFFTMWNSYYTT